MLYAIWYHLYRLKTVKKHPWMSVTFGKVAGFSMKWVHVLIHLTIIQNDAGMNPPPQKFKYHEVDNQMKNIVVD